MDIIGVVLFLFGLIQFFLLIGTSGDYMHRVEHSPFLSYQEGVHRILLVINEMWEEALQWGNLLCRIIIWIFKGPQIVLSLIIFSGYRAIRWVFIFLLRKRG